MEFNKAYNRNELVKFLRTSFLPEDFIQEETTLANPKQFQYTQRVTRLGECKSLELVVFEVMHSSVSDADKDTWWYDGQRIHFRSGNGSRLLALLRDKPFVTFSEMADYLSVNRSAVQKQIESFRKKGYLDRRDDGSWHVLALNSNIKKA